MFEFTPLFSYFTAFSNLDWWWYQLINHYTPEQWTVIGIIGGLFFTFLTWLTNFIFKILDERKKDR